MVMVVSIVVVVMVDNDDDNTIFTAIDALWDSCCYRNI